MLYQNEHNEWLLTVQHRAYMYFNRCNSQGLVRYQAWVRVRCWIIPPSDPEFRSTLPILQRGRQPKWKHGIPWKTSLHIESYPIPWYKSSALSFLSIVGKDLYETLPPQLREACEKERHTNCESN